MIHRQVPEWRLALVVPICLVQYLIRWLKGQDFLRELEMREGMKIDQFDGLIDQDEGLGMSGGGPGEEGGGGHKAKNKKPPKKK